jgi:hypothetical protein
MLTRRLCPLTLTVLVVCLQVTSSVLWVVRGEPNADRVSLLSVGASDRAD